MKLFKDNTDKKLVSFYKINIILLVVTTIALLFTLFQDASYIYGAFFGLIGVLVYLWMLHHSYKLDKKRWWITFFSFIFRVGVASMFFITPLIFINQMSAGLDGIDSCLQPVNVFVTIGFFFIPPASTFILHFTKIGVK